MGLADNKVRCALYSSPPPLPPASFRYSSRIKEIKAQELQARIERKKERKVDKWLVIAVLS